VIGLSVAGLCGEFSSAPTYKVCPEISNSIQAVKYGYGRDLWTLDLEQVPSIVKVKKQPL
jgi:hypothetical protein